MGWLKKLEQGTRSVGESGLSVVSGGLYDVAKGDKPFAGLRDGFTDVKEAIVGVPDQPDTSADDKLANVLKGYWSDYETKGLPLFDQLTAETTYGPNGQAVINREVNAGLARTNTAIDVSGQNQQEKLRGFGIQMTAEQQADNQRLQGLSRSSALTDTANRITQNLIDRNRAIATGGATGTIYREQVQGG